MSLTLKLLCDVDTAEDKFQLDTEFSSFMYNYVDLVAEIPVLVKLIGQ